MNQLCFDSLQVHATTHIKPAFILKSKTKKIEKRIKDENLSSQRHHQWLQSLQVYSVHTIFKCKDVTLSKRPDKISLITYSLSQSYLTPLDLRSTSDHRVIFILLTKTIRFELTTFKILFHNNNSTNNKITLLKCQLFKYCKK